MILILLNMEVILILLNMEVIIKPVVLPRILQILPNQQEVRLESTERGGLRKEKKFEMR